MQKFCEGITKLPITYCWFWSYYKISPKWSPKIPLNAKIVTRIGFGKWILLHWVRERTGKASDNKLSLSHMLSSMLHIFAIIYTDIQSVCLTWLSETSEYAEGTKKGEKGRWRRRCNEGRRMTTFNEADAHSKFVRPTYWNAIMKVEGKERKTDKGQEKHSSRTKESKKRP